MSRQTNGATTTGEFAVLAASVGIVENTEVGRAAFLAWFAQDQKAARAEVFKRVAARRAAPAPTATPAMRGLNAAETQGVLTGEPTHVPAWMYGGTRGAAAALRQAAKNGMQAAVVSASYPKNWLPSVGVAGRRHDSVLVLDLED